MRKIMKRWVSWRDYHPAFYCLKVVSSVMSDFSYLPSFYNLAPYRDHPNARPMRMYEFPLEKHFHDNGFDKHATLMQSV